MSYVGVRAALDYVIPTGVDGDEVFKFENLRVKMDGLEMVRRAATVIGEVNQRLVEKYSAWMTFTDSQYAYYRNGIAGRQNTAIDAEYTAPDARRGAQIGHMLPLEPYADAVGWTERYLKNANRQQPEIDLMEVADAWYNRFDLAMLTRALTNSENAIGSAGYDVPWAQAATEGTVDYLPPQTRTGRVFAATHSHFNWKDDDSAGYDDLFDAMIPNLTEHDAPGRPALYISEDDLGTVITDCSTQFISLIPEDVNVQAISNTVQYYKAGEFMNQPGEVVGLYISNKKQFAYILQHPRIPTDYVYGTMLGAPLASTNPLAVRTLPEELFGLKPEVQITKHLNPRLERLLFESEFGVGVNNRIGGVAGYIASGASAYVNPTIT